MRRGYRKQDFMPKPEAQRGRYIFSSGRIVGEGGGRRQTRGVPEGARKCVIENHDAAIFSLELKIQKGVINEPKERGKVPFKRG